MGLSYDEIKAAYEKEWASRREVRTRDEIPMAWELITPAWCTDVVIGAGGKARVTAIRLGEPDEGTSSRRRIHLEYDDAGKADLTLPPVLFCKATHRLDNRYIIGMNGGIEAETTFYNVVAPELDIEVPKTYLSRFDPASLNSIIVMRDMANDVRFCSIDVDLSEEQARSQMRLLARLHSAYYESEALSTKLAPWNLWEDYFNITAKEAGFEAACKRGFLMAEEQVPPSLFRRAAEIWPATEATVALNARLPRSLLHSDVHLKNWYIAAPDRMGVNDWQCSSKGHWSRDLSYCLSTCLSVEKRRAWERDLLTYYLELMHGYGVPRIAFDDAWLAYRQQMFAALAWWTGTLGQPPEAPAMQPRETSLTFIGRMTQAMEDLDSLGAARAG